MRGYRIVVVRDLPKVVAGVRFPLPAPSRNMLMNKLLIITDYQNDFVSPAGKVAQRIGNDKLIASQQIKDKITDLINSWHKKQDPILFLISDYNSENYRGNFKSHRKHGPYGDTAIAGTQGHELYGLHPGEDDSIITKNYFNGFYGTELETFLEKKQITSIYFCGVNTDVCVFHTAIESAVRGYDVYVIEDATETVTPYKEIFLNYLSDYIGVKIIQSQEINV